MFEGTCFLIFIFLHIEKSQLPLHGSFLTKNSSNAIQPPPTRTITVDWRIRTKRNFCESPN